MGIRWGRTQTGRGRAAGVAALTAGSLLVVACATTIAGTGVADQAAVISTGPSSGPTGSGVTSSTDTPAPPVTEDSSTAESTSQSTTESTSQSTTESTPQSTTESTSQSTTDSTAESTAPTSAGGSQFPTTPQQYPEFPPSAESAAVLEGRRMAAYVLLPSDYNPEYIDGSGEFPAAPLKSGRSLSSLFFDSTVPAVADRYGMIAGFYSSRNGTTKGDGLITGVFEFPDAKTATTAAKQLGAAAKSDADTKAAAIPGYAAAAGWTGSYPDQDTRYTQTFLASGSLVIYVWTESAVASRRDLAKDIAGVYDRQIALLKGFTPTPEAELIKQKLDPNGLLARTLPVKEGNGTVIDGNYSAKGFLHLTLNPPEDQKLYPVAGVDVVAKRGSTIYRAKDADGAAMVVDNFVGQIGKSDPRMTQWSPPPGADYAKCLQNTLAASYYCVATYGRYAVEFSEGDESAMAQAVAAQGTLLAGA